jgi:2-oxoglutarate ferredoxin oxidoreductase subunit gamma
MISRIVFSGSGGQGVITAAIIFAEAAVYYESLEAVQTQSYGPEARGGSARADVIIASDPIRFPKVLQPNILVALSQEAYDKYAWIVRPGGIVVIDTHFVKSRQGTSARQLAFSFFQSVQEELGSKLPMNMAVIGALAGITDYMKIESLEKSVASRFDERFREINLNALRLGHRMASEERKRKNLSVF